ncbi:MAG: dihydroorotate dehydrogenase electron transfer subunit [Gammaproteobacteria bacterium]
MAAWCTVLVASNRDSILVEQGEVLANAEFDGAQHVMRIRAPRIAERAVPGHFVHVRCAPDLMMRRPMSIMRVNVREGWIELLFKNHGLGTRHLGERRSGDPLSMIGPIGKPFKTEGYRRRPLLIGGGVGIPPMIFLADQLRQHAVASFVIMGSEVPFPFSIKPSQIMVPGVPPEVIGAMPLLEDWSVASRLASRQGYAGCFDGLVTELAAQWIEHRKKADRAEIEIFACGPTPMLKAVAELAEHYELPCQVSLEEYMACAVGGCAGCAVLVHTTAGPAMKRVCVDGPVFEASDVVFG